MARGVNKVTLIGHLGSDPEVRYLPSGGAVANITVATSEQWKDKQTGENKERTEWHRVVFFNRLAEIVGEYLKKGAQVYVEGRLQTEKWQDKQGNDRYTTKIYANEMQMLGSRATNMAAEPSGFDAPMGSSSSPSSANRDQSAPATMGGSAGLDDDIPF